jgi:hypothetical protein
MKVPNFLNDLRDGTFAEDSAIHVLTNHLGKFKRLNRPVGNEKYYDFEIKDTGGRFHTFEVKFDQVAARTGNIFFEILSNAKKLHLGAGIYSRAEWLILVIPSEGNNFNMHILKFEKLKALILKGFLEKKFKAKSVRFNYQCKGVIVPFEEIKDLISVNITYNCDTKSFTIDNERFLK